MQKTPLIKKIERTINPTVESMGFELVRVVLIGSGKPTLQIMAERPDGGITLDECAKLSQAISAILDVEETMGDTAYYLEVGSPGMDRPLTKLKDFERFSGKDVRLETDGSVEGRKRFKGTIKGIKGEQVVLIVEDENITIPFAAIEKAKLAVEEEALKPKPRKKH